MLARAETQLLIADVQPTTFVLNPLDMPYIETLKNPLGSYLTNEPGDADFADSNLWGLQVVVSNSMPAGQFVCGDFRNGCMLLDRMAATVELSTEHSDYFTRNLIALRCEGRVSLLVFAPWAFVKCFGHIRRIWHGDARRHQHEAAEVKNARALSSHRAAFDRHMALAAVRHA